MDLQKKLLNYLNEKNPDTWATLNDASAEGNRIPNGVSGWGSRLFYTTNTTTIVNLGITEISGSYAQLNHFQAGVMFRTCGAIKDRFFTVITGDIIITERNTTTFAQINSYSNRAAILTDIGGVK